MKVWPKFGLWVFDELQCEILISEEFHKSSKSERCEAASSNLASVRGANGFYSKINNSTLLPDAKS